MDMASILTWLNYLPSLARGWASLTQVACPAPLLPAAFPASMTGPTRQGVPGLTQAMHGLQVWAVVLAL